MDEMEATFMKNASVLLQDEMSLAQSMKKYVSQIKKDVAADPETARQEAKDALIRTGVATCKGNLKKVIVSWE